MDTERSSLNQEKKKTKLIFISELPQLNIAAQSQPSKYNHIINAESSI